METKKQFKWYTIFEYEKEQDYLRNMHRSGWKFVKVKGLGVYSFEKCVPQDVVYQLDYNKEGLSHKDEYLKMFDLPCRVMQTWEALERMTFELGEDQAETVASLMRAHDFENIRTAEDFGGVQRAIIGTVK